MRGATSLAVFLAVALLPQVWAFLRARRWGMPVTVTVDPEKTGPKEMAGYLAEIAQRMDAAPTRMRIVFRLAKSEEGEVPKRTTTYTLDIRPDGRLEIAVPGRRSHAFDLRGRWIPEHRVPLVLCGGTRPAVLYAAPTDANRFRVMDRLSSPRCTGLPVLFSLVAMIGVIGLVPECFAFVLGGVLASSQNFVRRGKTLFHGVVSAIMHVRV